MLPAELEILLTWRRRDEVVPDRNFVAKKLCELLHRSRNVMPRPLRIRMHYMYCTHGYPYIHKFQVPLRLLHLQAQRHETRRSCPFLQRDLTVAHTHFDIF